jgi:hypothetical protein
VRGGRGVKKATVGIVGLGTGENMVVEEGAISGSFNFHHGRPGR